MSLPAPARGLALALATLATTLVPAAAAHAAPAPPAPEPRVTQGPEPYYFDEQYGAAYDVNGSYTPVVGDFAGTSATDDILWYAPGTGAEQAWTSFGDGQFTKQVAPQPVNGSFTPLVGDFGGDQRDDIFWYGPGAAADRLWINTGNGTFAFTSYVVSVNGTFTPSVLENGTARSDIVWWTPGATVVPVWSFPGANGTHVAHNLTPAKGTRPVVGHFSTDHLDDVFWYGPGAVKDSLSVHDAAIGSFTTTPQGISGSSYKPVAGDWGAQGDGIEDILWLTPSGASPLWVSKGNGTWTTTKFLDVPHDATVVPFVPGGGWTTAYLYRPGTTSDVFYDALPTAETRPVAGTHVISSGYRPIVGRFSADHLDNVFWYKPGPAPEYLWR
ncbi:hypothetical protein KSP35_06190 [Aquihabitans sp. G128]|uniref:hypothetical protein n=1 Tax=Aquihabitans sp. G128 TaxID=2849779 RepID=UPI001C2459D0|nr:hypothetical protein [Aquihabitans sp. G128]QXC62388.1 hypothetical protein KSP35_06190 [Aquihabitans sp. G128]